MGIEKEVARIAKKYNKKIVLIRQMYNLLCIYNIDDIKKRNMIENFFKQKIPDFFPTWFKID